MKYLVISGNPKKEGLCHSVMEEVIRGAKESGAETEVLTLEKLERCHVCGDGWGPCQKQHHCVFGKDGFDAAQQKVREADQLCFITPVYWWEMAESLKSFFDRLRRCEFGPAGALSNKPVLLVVSAGGTGNGLISCLDQMERFCRHTGALLYDFVAIHRWNHDYKRTAAYAAARAMTSGRKAGETLV
jgi:multimeric flavodoxin WrbA